LSSFQQGFSDLRSALDGHGLKAGARYNVELVFEEIVGNIIRHAAPQGGELRIELLLEVGADFITMAFDDDGMPFDPCDHPDPVPPATLAEAPDGGLGLMMVRRTASAMQYQRTPDGRNHLIITLRANPQSRA
jgi:serine/threonine-protein kinase RsbW